MQQRVKAGGVLRQMVWLGAAEGVKAGGVQEGGGVAGGVAGLRVKAGGVSVTA